MKNTNLPRQPRTYTHYRVVHSLNDMDYDRPRHGFMIYNTLEEAQKVMEHYHRITEDLGKHPQGPIEIRRVTTITETIESSDQRVEEEAECS